MTCVNFGMSSLSNGFKNQAGKVLGICEYLSSKNLTAFEFSFGHGVRYDKESWVRLRKYFDSSEIVRSIHAPYYISCASTNDIARSKSISYITDTIEAAEVLGANKIVVHCGFWMGQEHEYALSRVRDILDIALGRTKRSEVLIALETMGKYSQIGDYTDIIRLCMDRSRLVPCFDFGHLNCIYPGAFDNISAYDQVFRVCKRYLSENQNINMHIHFSQIEYSSSGEVRHLNFGEGAEPNYKVFVESLVKNEIHASVICESAGNQDLDAAVMKEYYLSVLDSE